jgi:ion channel-forming bestrophin family protein
MVAPMKKKIRSQSKAHQKNLLVGSFQKKSAYTGFKQRFFQPKNPSLRSFKEKFRLYTGQELNWFQVTLHLAGTVISAIIPWVLLCGAYGFIVSLVSHFGHLSIFRDSKVLPNVVLSLNIVLSLLLVFRTNTAHERFWEGRKLWGALVNTVRNLARGIWIYIEEHERNDKIEKDAILRLVVAFTIAMKLHLRRDPVHPELVPLMSSFQYHKLQNVNHPPLEISLWIGDYLQSQYEREYLNVFQLTSLHDLVDDMIDILGGCERILKTPVPLIYTMTLKTLLLAYFLLLPWELVNGLTWWTGPILAIISFVLLGIDEIGAEIEEPFGHDPNDLPLDVICNTMLRNIEDLINLGPCKGHLSDTRDKAA